MRALCASRPAGDGALLVELRRIQARARRPVRRRLEPVPGCRELPAGFAEARHALVGTAVLQGSPRSWRTRSSAPYKYLLRIVVDGGVRDATAMRSGGSPSTTRSARRAPATLEEFLRRRGNISATSEALYVHPNTLRQRLRRIAELSGLDLRRDDWLMVEIAVKMVKLQQALGSDARRPDAAAAHAARGGVRHRAGAAAAGRSRAAPAEGGAHGIRPTPLARGHPQGLGGPRHRVLLRAVRRHVRTAEREAVPGRAISTTRRRRRGVRRVRGRRDRPGAERPRHRRDPRLGELHAGPLAAEPRALRVRRDGRGRGVAVLPADDPAHACSRSAKEKGSSSRWGSSSSTSSSSSTRTGRSRSRTATTRSRSPATTSPGLTRRYDFLTTVSRYCNDLGWGNYANDHEDANGQFEQNFTYDDALDELRPRDLLPLHGPHARGAARDDRDVHAEAVLEPDRQRLPLPHVALGRRHEPLPRRGRPARARALGDRVPLHRRAQEARARVQRGHRADRQLVQAAQARHDDERRDVVAGVDLVRLQQPHADAPHPGPGADRGPHDRRLLQPVSRRRRRARRRARRDRATASTPASRTRRTCTRSPTRSCARAGSDAARRTCSTRRGSSSATSAPRRRSAGAATRTTSTTSSASSATSGTATTSR